MDSKVTELILEKLKEIQHDTSKINVIEHDLLRLKQAEAKLGETIVNTVKNNSELNDTFNQRALEKTKAYLNTDEARKSLDSHVQDVLDKIILKLLLKWLAIQGTILVAIFSMIVDWLIEK